MKSKILAQKPNIGQRPALWLAGLLYGFASVSLAQPHIETVLDPLPPELKGLVVNLRHSQPPQIMVHNLTGETLEVLDSAGRPFLRIGPHHTHVDGGAAAFWQTRYRDSHLEQTDRQNQAENWQRLESDPAHAWFDPRLRPEAKQDDNGQWQIPVSLGTSKSAIRGRFVEQAGHYRIRLDNPGVLPENIRIHDIVLPRAGLVIHNLSDSSFSVLDDAGEAFLRFLPGRVLLNPGNPLWEQAAPADSLVPYEPGADKAQWVVIAAVDSYGWHDPRVQIDPDSAATPKTWRIPIRIGDREVVLEGRSEWLPGP